MAEVRPAFTTVMSTVLAAVAGAVAVICVSLFTVNDVAFVAPNLTAVAPVNPLPVMTTDVPPRVEPTVGEMPVMDAAVRVIVNV